MLKFKKIGQQLFIESYTLTTKDFTLVPRVENSIALITNDYFSYEDYKDFEYKKPRKGFRAFGGYKSNFSYKELFEEVKKICPNFPKNSSATNAIDLDSLLVELTNLQYIDLNKVYTYQGCRTPEARQIKEKETQLKLKEETAKINKNLEESKTVTNRIKQLNERINNFNRFANETLSYNFVRTISELIEINKEHFTEETNSKRTELKEKMDTIFSEIQGLRLLYNDCQAQLVTLENELAIGIVKDSDEFENYQKEQLTELIEKDKSNPRRLRRF